MKIKIHPVESKHDNDCWAVAISLFMNKPYDEVYNDLKHLLEEDGKLNNSLTRGYLLAKGYLYYNFDDDMYSTIQVLDTSKGIILDVEGHIVYVKNMTIYENIKRGELLWYLEKHKVEGFYVDIDKCTELI